MISKLFVACFPFRYSIEDLKQEFAPYGTIIDIKLYQDLERATFDRYAHIEIETDCLVRLLFELDGKHIGNKVLRVNELVARSDDLSFTGRS